MQQLENQFFTVYTPCHNMSHESLIEALAICHVEFILIHPFREGNGRLSRVLATLMALQAGRPPLNFTWMAENRDNYFAAIQQGHAGNYEPVKTIFSEVLLASQPAD